MTPRIEPARQSDGLAIEALLTRNHLPTDGVRERLGTATVLRDASGGLAGCAAVELYGQGALLRSVVVAPTLRGQGFAQALVDAAAAIARRAGCTDIYLLTTTAERYFERLGFRMVTRDTVPDAVRQSVEFQSACPDSATAMWRSAGPVRVRFACVHNAGRSQMAAALFSSLASPERAQAASAGTQPRESVHPLVVDVMNESHIDLSQARPVLLDEKRSRWADWLITMGCGEECPVIPEVRREDWPLTDPKGRPIEEVRRIRDQIAAAVHSLVTSNGWR